jgi:E3 ubiquitin-protein ligase HECTD2
LRELATYCLPPNSNAEYAKNLPNLNDAHAPIGNRDLLEYRNDWQLGSAFALVKLMFVANSLLDQRRPCHYFYELSIDALGTGALLDDFRMWESRRHKVTFCAYPFLLSMSAKLQILQYDANRQQTDQARKAWFQQFTSNQVVSSSLDLHIRRDCIAADTLREIKAVASTDSSQNDLRKALRVYFAEEDGIDAGGLRKEFFLLLMRELLDPQHGAYADLLLAVS